MEEVWRKIPGCNSKYEISNIGRVRSYGRSHPPYISDTPRLLKLYLRQGRPSVVLSDKDRRRYAFVSHLVLEVFVGPRPEGMHCAHLNGDREDSRLCNLKWVTAAENMAHKRTHGTDCVGSRSSNAKLEEEDAVEIRRLVRNSPLTLEEIARAFKVSKTTVHEIGAGRKWKHVTTSQDCKEFHNSGSMTSSVRVTCKAAECTNRDTAGRCGLSVISITEDGNCSQRVPVRQEGRE